MGNLKNNINNISPLPQSQLYKGVWHGSVAETVNIKAHLDYPVVDEQTSHLAPHAGIWKRHSYVWIKSYSVSYLG